MKLSKTKLGFKEIEVQMEDGRWQYNLYVSHFGLWRGGVGGERAPIELD